MENGSENRPDYVTALEAELLIVRAERAAALADRAMTLAELAVAKAKKADDQVIILRQKVHIEKLQRQLRGPKAERAARLIDQMELLLEDVEASATEDELAAEMAVAAAASVKVRLYTQSSDEEAVPSPSAARACRRARSNRLHRLWE
jgi:hypothetical protein